ncbi:hypothetical protein OB919_01995 [Halobacteria archaeon AArc-curdl1]|uniref:Uncharacterized protein n=1 Tax=Natronosalvus hydrolyticus TaxID=2979988 RepID=A0AAP3E4X7_9EURY|nr:hypothetical protein [Halobacteria archaeon AArc-curdl1]
MVLHFGKATGIYFKTMPFVLLRMGIGVLLGLATVLYFGILGFLAYTFFSESISGIIAIIGLLIALFIFIKAWNLFARYVLYLVKAGHIAVIAHIIDTGEVPSNQISYGTGQVKEHFKEASALFAVDMVVKAVIKQFNKRVVSFADLVSFVPNLKQIIQIIAKAITIAASYIDEAIIAYMFISEEENRWKSAGDGLVLYAKTWKSVLGSTLLMVLGMYAVALVLFLALSPVAGLLGGLSTTFELIGWVVIAGVLLTIYSGFLKPWVKTVVITTFLIEAQDETPDSQTRQYIEERSDKFKELLERGEQEETEGTTEKQPNEGGPATPA